MHERRCYSHEYSDEPYSTWSPRDLIWWKGGSAGEFSAYIGFSPAKGVGVFVLTNTDSDEPKEIGRTLLGSY